MLNISHMMIAEHLPVEATPVVPDLGTTFDAPLTVRHQSEQVDDYDEACTVLAERQQQPLADLSDRSQWIVAGRALEHQRDVLSGWYDEEQIAAAAVFAAASLETTWGDQSRLCRDLHWYVLELMSSIVRFRDMSEDLPRDFIIDLDQSVEETERRFMFERKVHFYAWELITHAGMAEEAMIDARACTPPGPQWSEAYAAIIDLAVQLQAKNGPAVCGDDIVYSADEMRGFREEAAALLDVETVWQMAYNPAV
ncbi:MAG TPA: hypothetical protein VLI54_02330 [Bacillota bacterium]|nr:hypothetical protein [Bacillota bacterium]